MIPNSRGTAIADELRRSLEGNAWHGPGVRQALNGISAAQALQRPIDKAHSVWELTLHIATWHSILLDVVRGGPYRNVPPDEEWPLLKDSSEPAWQRLTQSIFSTGEELSREIAGLTDVALHRKMEMRDYDLEFALHGLAQHNAFHTGQIILLKKLL